MSASSDTRRLRKKVEAGLRAAWEHGRAVGAAGNPHDGHMSFEGIDHTELGQEANELLDIEAASVAAPALPDGPLLLWETDVPSLADYAERAATPFGEFRIERVARGSGLYRLTGPGLSMDWDEGVESGKAAVEENFRNSVLSLAAPAGHGGDLETLVEAVRKELDGEPTFDQPRREGVAWQAFVDRRAHWAAGAMTRIKDIFRRSDAAGADGR